MTTRRKFITQAAMATGAAIAGAPAIIKPSRAAEAVSVATPLGFVLDFFDTMNAYSGGHYAKFGLDCKVIGANNGVQMTQLLVSGQVNFGRGGSPDLFRMYAGKQTFPVSISSINQDCVFRVFSLKSKPVLDPKEFKGKTIGLITLASASGVYLDVMLAEAGLKPDDVERQATGGTPGAVEILKAGRVDCFISAISVEVALERAGEPVVIWNPDKYLPLPGQCYLAMRETLAARPDTTVRFLQAIKSSVDEMFNEPLAPLIRRAAKDFDIPGTTDMDLAVAMVKSAMKAMTLGNGADLMINLPSRWNAGCAALRAAKLVDLADPSILYTNEYVDRALKS
jgi:NitT/TauT family transport system substrate-binding protein